MQDYESMCVVCLCSVLEDDIWNLYLTQSDGAGKGGCVCVRSAGAPREVNVGSTENIRK